MVMRCFLSITACAHFFLDLELECHKRLRYGLRCYRDFFHLHFKKQLQVHNDQLITSVSFIMSLYCVLDSCQKSLGGMASAVLSRSQKCMATHSWKERFPYPEPHPAGVVFMCRTGFNRPRLWVPQDQTLHYGLCRTVTTSSYRYAGTQSDGIVEEAGIQYYRGTEATILIWKKLYVATKDQQQHQGARTWKQNSLQMPMLPSRLLNSCQLVKTAKIGMPTGTESNTLPQEVSSKNMQEEEDSKKMLSPLHAHRAWPNTSSLTPSQSHARVAAQNKTEIENASSLECSCWQLASHSACLPQTPHAQLKLAQNYDINKHHKFPTHSLTQCCSITAQNGLTLIYMVITVMQMTLSTVNLTLDLRPGTDVVSDSMILGVKLDWAYKLWNQICLSSWNFLISNLSSNLISSFYFSDLLNSEVNLIEAL